MVLIDARHGLKQTDTEFIRGLDTAKARFQIVLTKCDLVEPLELTKRTQLLQQVYYNFYIFHLLANSQIRNFSNIDMRIHTSCMFLQKTKRELLN